MGIMARRATNVGKAGKQKKESPLGALSISERYTEIARIMGHLYISPFGAFGILAKANEAYLGHIESELRSVLSSADSDSKCIYVPKQRRYAHYAGGQIRRAYQF